MQTILPSSIAPTHAPLTTQAYIDLETTYGADNYHPLDVVITKGEGVWVWDIAGNQYLDCLSAIPPSIKGIATHAFCKRWSNKRLKSP